VGQQRLAVGARAVRVLLRRLAQGPHLPGAQGTQGPPGTEDPPWTGGARTYVFSTRLVVRQSSSRSVSHPGPVSCRHLDPATDV
jgi:hypothetical protein